MLLLLLTDGSVLNDVVTVHIQAPVLSFPTPSGHLHVALVLLCHAAHGHTHLVSFLWHTPTENLTNVACSPYHVDCAPKADKNII